MSGGFALLLRFRAARPLSSSENVRRPRTTPSLVRPSLDTYNRTDATIKQPVVYWQPSGYYHNHCNGDREKDFRRYRTRHNNASSRELERTILSFQGEGTSPALRNHGYGVMHHHKRLNPHVSDAALFFLVARPPLRSAIDTRATHLRSPPEVVGTVTDSGIESKSQYLSRTRIGNGTGVSKCGTETNSGPAFDSKAKSATGMEIEKSIKTRIKAGPRSGSTASTLLLMTSVSNPRGTEGLKKQTSPPEIKGLWEGARTSETRLNEIMFHLITVSYFTYVYTNSVLPSKHISTKFGREKDTYAPGGRVEGKM
ncbi:hypothetical protein EVAR_103137_1 [Eumeta japonica]|uniref:Uncharacterized protein n=1 Tax=Eumeta variegata TaxID=151549 RepID=A0A4C1X1C1_EUMVA|nr:hypothetical protein EVAR_103137_1 [Eumeta japonica]